VAVPAVSENENVRTARARYEQVKQEVTQKRTQKLAQGKQS
jgi:hypothetical protein